ncbi:MAG TPA: transferase [Desulfovibrio sp.]|jgi:Carbonic anhydrases/acetyltransferases, isoleucine patch superfamily|uniref:transferase n=1 Tax=Desulfovibrio sp. TaxID=885 RepID=UPI002CA2A934|nr:transferase [Desulfovibrio sp.]HMM39262.1 transferase [Desulfovibrio sp.]
MLQLQRLTESIIARINVNLRKHGFDAGKSLREQIRMDQFTNFYAFYGLTSEHPLLFRFERSSLSGSYLLGKCVVLDSIVYKSDVRGDELKRRTGRFDVEGMPVPMHTDESIHIRDSYLIKTLVHNFSHDPMYPESFPIHNTASMFYANIHGSPSEGCFMGAFSTVDLTTIRNCVIGDFAYVQTGELFGERVEPGHIWIRSEGKFDFSYKHSKSVLKRYVGSEPGKRPDGVFMKFLDQRKPDYERVFGYLYATEPEHTAKGSFVSRYSVVKGKSHIGENALVAQRAYVEESWLGKGANAQENCYILHSRLDGLDVTAHGGKVIHTRLGRKVFVGFNAFLRGTPEFKLKIGEGGIVMPHTIIDLREPLEIPPATIVWGYVRCAEDLKRNSISIEELSKVRGRIKVGGMTFEGDGGTFVTGFAGRIEHILEANGAFYDGFDNAGHAQMTKNIKYNIIQPYSDTDLMGIYPSMRIYPMEYQS